MIVIRDYQPQDSKSLAKIFENAILAIDNRIYSTSQKQAWIGNHSDEFWQSRFERTKPFVALIDKEPVGFIEFGLKDRVSKIDCFYIEPKFQQQGVGQALFEKVLSVAKGNNVYQINVSASHIAKPFFEKQGFQTVQKNSVERSGVILENWLMVLQFLD
nr:GNAT family N-acetyltransferase [Moraxella sp. CTOTU49097]